MKIGEEYMNQDKIIVELKKENDDDVLEFQFKNKVNINFIKSENNDIKEVFKKILEELTKNVFYLELKINEDYDVELYKEVATTYIDELNNEIDQLINSEEWNEIFK